jgi:hypothetical protein
MENHNFKKLLIIFSVILIIAIASLLFFFTDYIYNLNTIIKNKTQSYIFIKWIVIGFLINILISFLIILGNNYLNNMKGGLGQTGYKGTKGIKGDNCYICLEK